MDARPTSQTPSSNVSATQEAARAFIRRVMEIKGWTANRLAKEAKLSTATVHRALNDPRFVTSTSTLDRISKAGGVSWQLTAARSSTAGGFAEPEAQRYTAEQIKWGHLDITGNEAAWVLATRAVELAGYLPGDHLLVSPDATARAGDLVCAQVYNLQLDTAETVFRVYDPPYLIPRTMDPSISSKPLLVDNERVMIWGVVLKCLRVRSAP